MSTKQKSTIDKKTMISLYETMATIRECELQLVKLYAGGQIYGGVHTYIGEEAVATGVSAHLSNDDLVFSTHRGHGHALAKGVAPKELMAELLGRVDGCSGGRGGSMHLFKPEVGFMGSSGIVGPSILLAAGTAYTAKLLKSNRIGVAYFGDGATNNGAFHEGLNLSAVWELPVLFVCENNLYATEVPYAKATKNQDIASRAAAYGMPGIAVDGNDVTEVYRHAGEAIARARAGKGPTLLECRTYRTRPHSEGMRDAGYRTKEEVGNWKKRDPIAQLRDRMLSEGVATTEELDDCYEKVKKVAAEARDFAVASPMPDPGSVTRHVYSEG